MKKLIILMALFVLLTGCARQQDDEWGKLGPDVIPVETTAALQTLPPETQPQETEGTVGLIERPGMVYTVCWDLRTHWEDGATDREASSMQIFRYNQAEMDGAMAVVMQSLEKELLVPGYEAGGNGFPPQWQWLDYSACELVQLAVDLEYSSNAAEEAFGGRMEWANENYYAHYVVVMATLDLTKSEAPDRVKKDRVSLPYILYRDDVTDTDSWRIAQSFFLEFVLDENGFDYLPMSMDTIASYGLPGEPVGGYVLEGSGDARVYMYMEETDEVLCYLFSGDEEPRIWAYDEGKTVVAPQGAE